MNYYDRFVERSNFEASGILYFMAVIECVPNFSEGRDLKIIGQIVDAIRSVAGLKVLHVDVGISANRTVVTFAGKPEAVVEGAFNGIHQAAKLINMEKHRGVHPRIGATDVCPLVPVSDISMEETAAYARQLGKRVGEELGIPVYLYEKAAMDPTRVNLADVRAGGYESLFFRLQDNTWRPDFGTAAFNKRSGATIIGARDFLLAYNVNLDTGSLSIAKSIAAEIRTSGRIKKVSGQIEYDKEKKPLRMPGLLPFTKAIGWYMEEYKIAQVSMNLTNLDRTPMHVAFEAVRKSALKLGSKVTGSEIIGLVPLKSMLDAGRYFMGKKTGNRSEDETLLVGEAVSSLGLDELKPFDPQEKILEYVLTATTK